MTADPRSVGGDGASCEAALAAFARNALDPTVALPPLVVEHVRQCPSCRERLERLASAVLSNRDDEITCAECQAWLVRYVDAGLATTGKAESGSEAPGTTKQEVERGSDDAGDVRDVFGRVSRHLSSCEACTEELAWLTAALDDLVAGTDLVAVEHPEFDLSFLSAAPDPEGAAPMSVLPAAIAGRASAALFGARERMAALVAGFRQWAERRASQDGNTGPAAQARSVGVLVPIVVVLAVALGVLWATMKALPAVPELVTARQTAAAARTGTAAANAIATGTAEALSTGSATATAPPDGGVGSSNARPTVGASPVPTEPPTPAADSSPQATNSDKPDEGNRKDETKRRSQPSVTPELRPTAAPGAVETAYPPWWPSDPPPTGYPPPGTGSAEPASTGTPSGGETPTPSTPRPRTATPSAPPR